MVKFLVVIFLLVVSKLVSAHDNIGLTEKQIIIVNLQNDLENGFERATLLQTTLISGDLTLAKKCGYLSELSALTIQLDFMLSQYASAKDDTVVFYDDSEVVRQMYAEQLRNRLNTIEHVIPTFKRNNQCI